MQPLFDFSRIPNASETLSIRSFIEKKREETSILRSTFIGTEVSRAEPETSVQNSIKDAEESITSALFFIAPIRKLVADVLILIFSECISDDPFVPWRLAGINSVWRRILSFPTLWSKVILKCPGYNADLNSATMFCKLWIQRSGCLCPLEIELYNSWNRSLKEDTASELRDYLCDVYENKHRWRSYTADVMDPFLPLTGENLSLLRTLKVKALLTRPYSPQSLINCSPTSTPCLREVEFENVDWVSPAVTLRGLHRFSYHGGKNDHVSYRNIMDLLALSPHLQNLSFCINSNPTDENEVDRAAPLLLSSLTELELLTRPVFHHILKMFEIPVLRKFILVRPYGRWSLHATADCLSEFLALDPEQDERAVWPMPHLAKVTIKLRNSRYNIRGFLRAVGNVGLEIDEKLHNFRVALLP